MPVSPVQSQPLAAPIAGTSLPPPAPATSKVSAVATPRLTQSVAGWSAQGGSPIIVGQGENANVLANRYGVPVDVLIRTNGFASATDIQPGSHIVIPVYNATLATSNSGGMAPAKATVQVKTAPVKSAQAAAQVKSAQVKTAQVKTAQNKPAEERRAPVKIGDPPRTLAAQAEALKAANSHAAKSPGKPAENASVKTVAVKNKPQKVATIKKTPEPEPAYHKPEPERAVKAETPHEPKSPHDQTAAPAKSAEAPPTPVSPTPEKAAASAGDGSVPEFRWPAHGRIIQAFKPGGNDGINIAVPEGTSIKAVEGGVVAYAGNELKGYGNLILIRHPNGFVSAYANTSDIEVKRGETVKRGQVIAKSGQSGNVASPQLHFELRKGTTPVDPTQYLAGV
ncbi:MAG TPA: peptidoglycan DD-metalloendopeptidase family protein [Methylocella sp.]|nr:peptidoglycan DD-metalloendopeptidase family protein [Methylocella sp.]